VLPGIIYMMKHDHTRYENICRMTMTFVALITITFDHLLIFKC